MLNYKLTWVSEQIVRVIGRQSSSQRTGQFFLSPFLSSCEQKECPVPMPVPIPCSSAYACTSTMCQHSNSPLSWSVVTAAVRPTPEEPRPVVAIARGAVFSTYLTHCHNEITSDTLPCVAYKHQTHRHNEITSDPLPCVAYKHQTHRHNEITSDPLPCVAYKHHTHCHNETYQTHCHVYTHVSDTLLKRSTSNPLPRVAHKCNALPQENTSNPLPCVYTCIMRHIAVFPCKSSH